MNILEIENLVSKYWNCETSVEEEIFLRNFFTQGNVPDELEKYSTLFRCQKEEHSISLSDDFDKKILSIIATTSNKKRSLFPKILRVAAIGLLCLMVGGTTAYLLTQEEKVNYSDTYTDPEDAFKVIQSAVFAVSVNLQEGQKESMEAIANLDIFNEYIPSEDDLTQKEELDLATANSNLNLDEKN